ncbi:MAG TPA: hypothetical protein VGD37_36940 [Kofleriaceae bacterium]
MLATHAVTPAVGIDTTGEQVRLHPLRELRMRIEDRADGLELANVLVAEWSWN